MLLPAVATWRAGKFPQGVPALWIGAVVADVLALAAPALERVLFAVGGVPFGLGFIGTGVWVWSGRIAIPLHAACASVDLGA